MKNYFKKALELYVGYKKELVTAHNIYDFAKKSDNYSQKKLDEFFKESQEAIGNADISFSRRLNQLESEFIDVLKDMYNPFSERNAGMYLRDHVAEILRSDLIDFTPAEYEDMAKRYADNLPLSRVIHDYAARHGYNLRNYVSLNDRWDAFDRLKGALTKLSNSSMPDNDRAFREIALFQENLTSESNLEEVGEMFASHLPTIDYKCIKFGDMDAEIAADQAAEEAKQEYDEDNFLRGLGKEPEPEAVKTLKKLQDDIALLSPEEKADAELYAFDKGLIDSNHKPIITPEAIAWLKTDECKQFKEEINKALKEAKEMPDEE